MLYPLIGLLAGLLIGVVLPFEIPLAYSSYLSIAILASLNSVFGGIQADLEGKFDQKLFITGFFGNTILAALLTYIGDRVGIPIYYAAIFYFGTSLFSNFAKIRRYYFRSGSKKSDPKAISKEQKHGHSTGHKAEPIEIIHSTTDDLDETEDYEEEDYDAVELDESGYRGDVSDEDEIFEDDEELDEEQKNDDKKQTKSFLREIEEEEK